MDVYDFLLGLIFVLFGVLILMLAYRDSDFSKRSIITYVLPMTMTAIYSIVMGILFILGAV